MHLSHVKNATANRQNEVFLFVFLTQILPSQVMALLEDVAVARVILVPPVITDQCDI
ncbi:MAG: hypothetical protein ABFD58_09625 [Anaerolineaceae bacterium]|jgi:hypothetical protein